MPSAISIKLQSNWFAGEIIDFFPNDKKLNATIIKIMNIISMFSRFCLQRQYGFSQTSIIQLTLERPIEGGLE